jgi:hypothetical protein
MAVQFGIGLVLAFALNVDTLNLIQDLDRNEGLRQTLVASAEAYARTDANRVDPTLPFDKIDQRLKETGLPLGWANTDPTAYIALHGKSAILGWILTALAGSLGAPFWFDLLKQVANLRATGPKPEPEKKKDAA